VGKIVGSVSRQIDRHTGRSIDTKVDLNREGSKVLFTICDRDLVGIERD